MANALGHFSFAQVGDESTYGVAGPVTQRVEVVSCGLELVNAPIMDKALYSARSRRGFFQGPRYYRGPLVLRGNYEGMLKFWKGALPTTSSTAVDTTARDHVMKEAVAGAVLPSLTFELNRGNVSPGLVERYVGCSILKATHRGEASDGDSQLNEFEFDIHARDCLYDQFPSPFKQINVTCNLTTSSTGITRSAGDFNADGVKVGDVIVNAAVPVGTTVVTINSATSITMSAAATSTTSAVLTFTDDTIACSTTSGSPTVTRPVGSFITDGVVVGDTISGPGIPAGTTVTVVGSATSITISQNANATAGTPTFALLTFTHNLPSILGIRSIDMTVTLDDGTIDVYPTDISFQAWEIAIENNMDLTRFEAGSVLPLQPLPNDFMKATWQFTKRYRTTTAQKVAQAGTAGSPQVVFRDSSVKIGQTPNAFREFELRSNNAFIPQGGVKQELAGYGELKQTLNWEALFDPTDVSCIVARFRNMQQAI